MFIGVAQIHGDEERANEHEQEQRHQNNQCHNRNLAAEELLHRHFGGALQLLHSEGVVCH